MNEKADNLTKEQSLGIITDMIHLAKGNVSQASFYLLLWGWVVMIANLGHYYLQVFTDYPAPPIVWIISIPAGLASAIYGYRENKKVKVFTHLSKIYFSTWVAFVLSLIILLVFLSNPKGYYLLNPMILILAAIATYISGMTLKFTPLVVGAILFWIFAIISLMLKNDYQYLISATAVLTGYLVPGYMLKNKFKNNGI